MSNIDFIRLVVANLEYINQSGVVTFSQLQRAQEQRFEVYGSAGLAARANPNIIFWTGMAEQFMRTIEWLFDEGEIRKEYISPVLYYSDHFILGIPPIDSQRIRFLLEDWDEYARIIEQPVWFPVVLTPKSVTVADLLREPITPLLLQAVLDSADAEHIQRERFGEAVSNLVGEPSPNDGTGKGNNNE